MGGGTPCLTFSVKFFLRLALCPLALSVLPHQPEIGSLVPGLARPSSTTPNLTKNNFRKADEVYLTEYYAISRLLFNNLNTYEFS